MAFQIAIVVYPQMTALSAAELYEVLSRFQGRQSPGSRSI